MPRYLLMAFAVDDPSRRPPGVEDLLRRHELLFGDDGLMVVFEIELVLLAEVAEPFLGDGVDREGLTQEDIAGVLLVP